MLRTLRLALVALLALVAFVPAARADGPANGGLSASANPLAGVHWGGYRPHTVEPANDPLGAYWGSVRSGLIGRVIEQPRARWFGSWIPTTPGGGHWGAAQVAASYVDAVTHGNPNVGVQLALFRLDPFEKQIRSRLPDAGAYQRWMSAFLGGIPAHTRMAVVLQPDLPIALDAPDGGAADLALIRWTVARLEAPKFDHVTVYLDAGASDWLSPAKAAALLRRAGVAGVRGFALNLTHYASNANERRFGHAVIAALARSGIPGKHFIISSAMNGHPFASANPAFHSPRPCGPGVKGACEAIGRPFTTATGDPALDAYAWMGRWWYDNAGVRSRTDLLRLIAGSPFRSLF